MKSTLRNLNKGKNGFKRRGNYHKDKGYDNEGLAMGRDINISRKIYGEGSLSIEDVDSIPGVEDFLRIKNGE